MIMRYLLSIKKLIMFCLFALLVYSNNADAQLVRQGAKAVVRSFERSTVEKGAKVILLAKEPCWGSSGPNILRYPPMLQKPSLLFKRPIKLYEVSNISFTKQYVCNGEEGLKVILSPAKNYGLNLFVLDKELVRTQKELKDNYSCFISSNRTEQQVKFRSFNLKPEEVQHMLHRLDILQTDISTKSPVFIGDFSKATLNVTPEYVDVILPVAQKGKPDIKNLKLLVRVMGVLPVSLRNAISNCMMKKCSPEAVVLQLMNDLIKNNIRREQLKCELLHGIMALNDRIEAYDRNYFT